VREQEDQAVVDPVEEDEIPPGEHDDAGDAEPDDVEEAEAQASELLEKVGRDASMLVLREVELTTSRHIPELRRAARDLAVVVVVALVFVTAFALVNWALVNALSSTLPSWRAPLVLAAVWAVVGALLFVFVVHRADQLLGWRIWQVAAVDSEERVREREQARDDAQHSLRESLQEFAGSVAREAGVLVAAAVVPIGGAATEAGEKMLDAVDDATDVIEEKLPGGSVINRVADLALKPGRYALGAVNKGLKRDGPGEG
jgi:hypothetical protein